MIIRWRAIAVGAVFGAILGFMVWIVTRSLLYVLIGTVLGALYGAVFGRDRVDFKRRATRRAPHSGSPSRRGSERP